MKIVPTADMPDVITDCPTDDLLTIYAQCLQMEQICKKEEGIGLSAVQVGLPWRLFIVRYDEQTRFFVNCEYDPIWPEKQKSLEGCLSLRNPDGSYRYFLVERYKHIRVTGQELEVLPKLTLQNVAFQPEDHYISVFQYEIDHQRKITIDRIGLEYSVWR